jgi:hypothetical protein
LGLDVVLKLNKSRYQVQELTKRWAKLFDETITDSYILQWAIDYKFSLYTPSPGALQVNLWTRLELGSPQRKIVAYLSNEFIKLTDDHIRCLLGGKPTTILFANLSESDFIQGDESFDLSKIEAAILDEKERIEITPDDISYLSVTVEDVIAFEQELRRVRDEHHPKSTTSTSGQERALKQATGTGNDGANSQGSTEAGSVRDGVNKKRTRKDNLSRAIDAAIQTFDKKPSFDELWQFFQDDKDETGFIEDCTDTHVIWRGTKGKFHDTQKESLANRLSQIKS